MFWDQWRAYIRGSPYPRVIVLALFLTFPQIQPAKTLLSTTPLSFDAPLQGTAANIRTKFRPILPETRVVGNLAYIFAADSVGLSSTIFCGGFRKRVYFHGKRVRNGCSRSFKVVDFGTNRKRIIMQIPISHQW